MDKRTLNNEKQLLYYHVHKKQLLYYYANKDKRLQYMKEYRKKQNLNKPEIIKETFIKIQYGVFIIDFN